MRRNISAADFGCVNIISIHNRVFQADCIIHTDRICGFYICGCGRFPVHSLYFSRVKTYRKQRGWDLYCYFVTLLICRSMCYSNLDITEIMFSRVYLSFLITVVDCACKCIGRSTSVIRGHAGNLFKLLACKHNCLEILDFHVVTKGICKSEVTYRLTTDLRSSLNRRRSAGTKVIINRLENIIQ